MPCKKSLHQPTRTVHAESEESKMKRKEWTLHGQRKIMRTLASNRKGFEPQRMQKRRIKTTSQTEAMFPMIITCLVRNAVFEYESFLMLFCFEFFVLLKMLSCWTLHTLLFVLCSQTSEVLYPGSMNNFDQSLSGKVGVGKTTGRRHHLHPQQIGGSQENGMNHNKNGKISSGVKSGKYSLSEPSTLLQESCTFVSLPLREQTVANFVHAMVGEDRTPRRTERVAQTHVFFSRRAHLRHHQRTRWLKRHVDCFNPRASQKSFGHLIFHGTLLESQFSSPSPFCTFLSALFRPLSDEHCISAEFFNKSKLLRHSLAAWPSRALSPRVVKYVKNITAWSHKEMGWNKKHNGMRHENNEAFSSFGTMILIMTKS